MNDDMLQPLFRIAPSVSMSSILKRRNCTAQMIKVCHFRFDHFAHGELPVCLKISLTLPAGVSGSGTTRGAQTRYNPIL